MVSISLSLVAVFIPILMMGGVVGRLFREFAVVLAAAILVSMVVSLTTTPMMAATLLAPRKAKAPQGTDRAGARRRPAGRGARLSALADLDAAAPARGAAARSPQWWCSTCISTRRSRRRFFPQQDTGVLIGGVQADQGSSFQMMQQRLETFMAIVGADPAVASVTGSTGVSGGPAAGSATPPASSSR